MFYLVVLEGDSRLSSPPWLLVRWGVNLKRAIPEQIASDWNRAVIQ
jgi:hypothetical protein